jgi:hypothetical protein
VKSQWGGWREGEDGKGSEDVFETIINFADPTSATSRQAVRARGGINWTAGEGSKTPQRNHVRRSGWSLEGPGDPKRAGWGRVL